jgi:hypothetical protein
VLFCALLNAFDLATIDAHRASRHPFRYLQELPHSFGLVVQRTGPDRFAGLIATRLIR